MIPILFESDATAFTTHGLGDLTECVECKAKITEEGEYELSFSYPRTGELFSELRSNRIVVAKVNDYDPLQAFRIYGFEKTLDGMIQVSCQHLSYDLSRIPVQAFSKHNNSDIKSASVALTALKNNRPNGIDCPFMFTTTFPNTTKPHTDDEKFKIEEPTSMRAALLDGDDSILGCWGGDLIFDNTSICLAEVGGEDRGIVLEYGVDLIDLSVEEDISEMVTGVFPYWRGRVGNSSEDTIIYGSVQYASGTFTHHNILSLDLSQYFPNGQPTSSQLNAKARAWMTAEKIGYPEFNVTLSYAALGHDVRMYDAITVRFPEMDIDVKAKVSSYTYDVLNEICTEIEVGNSKTSSTWKGLEDASRLKRGLLPPKRIAKSSIGSSQLGYGAVGSTQLAEGAVEGAKLNLNSVKQRFGTYFSQLLDGVISQSIKDAYDAGTAAQASISDLINDIKNANTFADLKEAAKDKG